MSILVLFQGTIIFTIFRYFTKKTGIHAHFETFLKTACNAQSSCLYIYLTLIIKFALWYHLFKTRDNQRNCQIEIYLRFETISRKKWFTWITWEYTIMNNICFITTYFTRFPFRNIFFFAFKGHYSQSKLVMVINIKTVWMKS